MLVTCLLVAFVFLVIVPDLVTAMAVNTPINTVSAVEASTSVVSGSVPGLNLTFVIALVVGVCTAVAGAITLCLWFFVSRATTTKNTRFNKEDVESSIWGHVVDPADMPTLDPLRDWYARGFVNLTPPASWSHAVLPSRPTQSKGPISALPMLPTWPGVANVDNNACKMETCTSLTIVSRPPVACTQKMVSGAGSTASLAATLPSSSSFATRSSSIPSVLNVPASTNVHLANTPASLPCTIQATNTDTNIMAVVAASAPESPVADSTFTHCSHDSSLSSVSATAACSTPPTTPPRAVENRFVSPQDAPYSPDSVYSCSSGESVPSPILFARYKTYKNNTPTRPAVAWWIGSKLPSSASRASPTTTSTAVDVFGDIGKASPPSCRRSSKAAKAKTAGKPDSMAWLAGSPTRFVNPKGPLCPAKIVAAPATPPKNYKRNPNFARRTAGNSPSLN